MTFTDILATETNKLKLLLYVERNGLPEKAENRIKLLKLLNSKDGYPVRYSDLIEWMPIINDCWSKSFIEETASQIKNPIAWQQEIRNNPELTEEQKALMLFALPL